MNNSNKLKRVWIIGASQGIGEAMAKALAQQGSHLILSARNHKKLDSICSQLPGKNHRVLPLDVTDTQQWRQVIEDLNHHNTLPTCVIYNAGAYEARSLGSISLQEAEQIIDVNLRGAFRALDAIKPWIDSQSLQQLVWVASLSGYRGLPQSHAYGASKSGLQYLAECCKLEYEGKTKNQDTSLKVQMVNPGFVKTHLTDKNDFEMPALITPEQAAHYIVKKLPTNTFDISFPARFAWPLKLISLLPNWLYFPLIKKIVR